MALLKADYVNPELIPVHGDLPDMFRRFLQSTVPGIDWELVSFEIRDQIFPTDCFDAYLISGSRFSVNDDFPWIRALADFINERRVAGSPVIGFCFGHQIIAKAIGGKVGKLPGGPNVGLRPLRILALPTWIKEEPSEINALFNHGEQVTLLPAETTLIATGPDCAVKIFQHGAHLLGIQFHPEYTLEYQSALMNLNLGLDMHARLDADLRNQQLLRSDQECGSWLHQFILEHTIN